MSARLFSSTELAALKLPGMPTSRENCSRFIKRVAASHPQMVHQRQGRGGGRLVDIKALPNAAQSEFKAREKKQLPKKAQVQDEVDAIERSVRIYNAEATLTPNQHLVAMARYLILMAIDAEAAAAGMNREKVIQNWSGASEAFYAPISYIVRRANQRSDRPTLGRSTLYRWNTAFLEKGIIGLAPRLPKRVTQ